MHRLRFVASRGGPDELGGRQIFGGDMRRILPPIEGSIPLLGMTYPKYRLFMLAVSSLLLLAIWLFFTKTRAGIVVLHLSNRNLDLMRPVAAVAKAAGGYALAQNYTPTVDDEGKRFLSLTGIAIHQDHARDHAAPRIGASLGAHHAHARERRAMRRTFRAGCQAAC